MKYDISCTYLLSALDQADNTYNTYQYASVCRFVCVHAVQQIARDKNKYIHSSRDKNRRNYVKKEMGGFYCDFFSYDHNCRATLVRNMNMNRQSRLSVVSHMPLQVSFCNFSFIFIKTVRNFYRWLYINDHFRVRNHLGFLGKESRVFPKYFMKFDAR